MALATMFETNDAVIQPPPQPKGILHNFQVSTLLSFVAMTTEANKGESRNAIMSQIMLLKEFFQ